MSDSCGWCTLGAKANNMQARDNRLPALGPPIKHQHSCPARHGFLSGSACGWRSLFYKHKERGAVSSHPAAPSTGCVLGSSPGWPAFPSSHSTRVLACVGVSRGMSVHGQEWVWMHVGARGWAVLPPAEVQHIGLCRWRGEQAGEGPLVLADVKG